MCAVETRSALERKGTERELAHTAAEDELRNDVQANHATLLEPDVAPSDEKLCIHGFEHIAESFFKFDHQWARHRIQLDVLAMARLKQLALEGLSLEELLEHRAELLRILRSPPPELLVA